MQMKADVRQLKHFQDHIEIFQCPSCEGGLVADNEHIICKSCHHSFLIDEGIPLLFYPNQWGRNKSDVTQHVKSFYEEYPFPHYEEFENAGDLSEKAKKSIFARLLNEQMPFNIRILEAGCGTGQLSNFLGISHRHIFGADVCLNSLKLGQSFKNKNGLDRVGFYQMNLFKPIFKEKSFSVVICSGVLHHTSNPKEGFKSIARLVQPGGSICIGLYNTYGRLITDLRRLIFNCSGNNFKWLDPRLRQRDRGNAKRESWFRDQYKHPHESKHTMRELQTWFEESGFEFLYGIPCPSAFKNNQLDDRIFDRHPGGNTLDHFIAQTKMFFNGSREGGLFIMMGKRR